MKPLNYAGNIWKHLLMHFWFVTQIQVGDLGDVAISGDVFQRRKDVAVKKDVAAKAGRGTPCCCAQRKTLPLLDGRLEFTN